MEQLRNRLGLRVNASPVRSFVQVAIDAHQYQVVEIVRAAVNLWDDMLDVKGRQWRVLLVHQAILATIAGALPDAGSRARAYRLRGGANQLPCLPLQDGDELSESLS